MMARHFISNGPPFAAGTAAGGTLILFGCDLSSITANFADRSALISLFRFGRGKSCGGLPFLPKGPLSPVHNLKSIPSFFGFRVSKHPLNCTVEPLPVIHKFRSPNSPACPDQLGMKEISDVQKGFAAGAKNVG